MRVENCMLILREVLPESQYTEVRQAVHQWNVANDSKRGRPRKVQP